MTAPTKGSEDVQNIKEQLDKDNRDVADLWSEALRKYKGIAGTDLQPKFKNVDEMISFGTQEMNAFHKFRHNQKKVDKLRGLFMANIGYIEKGAQQLIAAATPAFPPAAAIGTALTYVLSACKAVSADYDVVMAFFEDLSAFLQRITILESRLPQYPAYRNCLMDVFSSLLSMCGFATKYIELGRFKKWVINLVGGQDGELSGARAGMDKQLARLQSATEFAILGNTEKLQDMNVELQQNQDLQTQMMEDQTKMLTTVVESQEAVRNDLKNIQKLLTMFQSQKREDTAKRIPKAATQGKSPTSLRVRTFFQDMLDPVLEHRNVRDYFVSDTCQWIFEEEQWDKQIGPTEGPAHVRILAISGPVGIGKSHLAVSAYDHLVKHADANTCVASFYFRRNRSQDLRALCNAMNWIVIQAAEQNAVVCEKLNVQLAREDLDIDPWEWKEVWTNLVVPMFPANGQHRLQIVWDGLDELEFGWKDDLLQFIAELKGSPELNISLICTTREDKAIDGKLQEAGAEYIKVSKDKQFTDFQALVWNHLNNDEGLKRFSKFGKQTIVSTLVEKSDVLLYAEEVLRQFNTIRREPLVLKQLNQLSGNWLKLYEYMLHELEQHTPEHGKKAVETLLYWLSFSYDNLTLDQCIAILAVTGHGDFDLERELQGNNLTKFLRLADTEERSEDDTDFDNADVSILDNNAAETESTDGNVPLRFHHRSMREFCRSAAVDDTTIRVPDYQAQSRIFRLMVRILSGEFGDADLAIRPYAARYWAYHLSWTNVVKSTEEEKISAIESIAVIVLNKHDAALRMEANGVDYDEQALDFNDIARQCFAFYAKTAVELESKLDSEIVAWARSVVESTENAFVPLLKAHITNWLQAKDLKSIKLSYKFARTCAKLTHFKTCIKEDDTNEDDDEDDDDESETFAQDEILGLYKSFDDVPKDGNAFWALAALLQDNGHYEEARSYAQQALEQLTNQKKIIETLNILADAQLGLEDNENALQTTQKALAYSDIEPKLRRQLLVILAKVQAALGKVDLAATAYKDARAVDTDEAVSGDVLDAEYQLYADNRSDAELIALIQEWTVTEQLTCMTLGLDDGRSHVPLHYAAGRCGQEDIIYRIYEDVIKLLDTVAAGAPIRYWYAMAKWGISGDLDAAKSLLNEILDAPSDGWAYKFSNVEPAVTLADCMIEMGHIIYDQYRATTDRETKAKLFVEIQGLTTKPMAQSIQLNKTETLDYSVKVAKMSRKMSTAMEFQDRLNGAFETCYEALVDTVGWNDWQNIISLAIIISQLPGMEREASILLSAMFSELDESGDDEGEAKEEGEGGAPAEAKDAVGGANEDDDDDEDEDEEDDDNDEDDDEEDGDEKGDKENGDNDDGDDETPADEGDISGAWMNCSGDCVPTAQWEYWKGRSMHVCLTCRNCALCEPCYKKRLAMNENTELCPVKGPYFCDRNHKYLEAPVEGWGGITKGVMSIEGEEDVQWKVWLEELRNEKWVKAWERFWLEED